jgi:hypothetical protein
MSAPNVIMAPSTTAQTLVQFDATEADKIAIMVTGVGLAGGETIGIFMPTPDAGAVAVFDPTLTAAYSFTATSTKVIELEGGFLYAFTKSATAGLVGLGVAIKRSAGT